MNRPGKYRLAAFALLLVPALWLAACSEKITNTSDQTVELRINTLLNGSAGSTQAVTFLLTVTGVGIDEPIEVPLVNENGVLAGSVVVPAGPKRTFRIRAFNSGGVLMYAGQTTTDIESGESINLTIDLVPQVPMIKVSPTYLQAPQGTVLAMTVKVYHLIDLTSIEGFLENMGLFTKSMLYEDSVVLNPELAGSARLTWWNTDVRIYFLVEHLNPTDPIVDADGYARLFTAYYPSYDLYDYPVEDYTFTPILSSLMDRFGNQISVEGVYAEESRVELYQHQLRLRAYYHMGWGTGTENEAFVEDRSGHGLNGIASGTTIDYGAIGDARVFDGINDYINVPDNNLLDLDEALTLAFWLNVDLSDTDPTTFPVITKRNQDGAINYQILLQDTSNEDGFVSILFRYGDSIYHTYRVDIPDLDLDWYRHFIFSYEFGKPASALLVADLAVEGYDYRSYEGAWIVGDGRAPAPVTGGALLIGRDNTTHPRYYKGGIDEVEIYDDAFDLDYIEYLYRPR
jgi:hypothetical protein